MKPPRKPVTRKSFISGGEFVYLSINISEMKPINIEPNILINMVEQRYSAKNLICGNLSRKYSVNCFPAMNLLTPPNPAPRNIKRYSSKQSYF